MKRSPDQLRRDALQIWQAGVDAVRSDRLVRNALRVDGSTLVVGQQPIPLEDVRRIAVVGAGKAGAGMAAAVEEVLGEKLSRQKQLTGWVNVPADCVRDLRWMKLHGARPPGVNEPTPEGAAGSREIVRIVESLGPEDLCLGLISGGGSALMPAPAEGVSLEEKQAVTRLLSGAGADIWQLNTVRKQLSRIKGGGLARACRAGRLATLIISDVLGDPLDVIASGPTVEDRSTAADALEVLDRFGVRQAGIARGALAYLEGKRQAKRAQPIARVTNLIIGNNATAVDAAGIRAEALGYSHAMLCATESEGAAEEIGRHLAGVAAKMRREPGPDCLITGGEPVVSLCDPSIRGRGGRNQQLVLAALDTLFDDGAGGLALLSGGTDGEDGPTDAAGAILDVEIAAAARQLGLDPADYLARNDAYSFFEPLDGLIKTGPTNTNVCDVRVIVVDRNRRKDKGRPPTVDRP